jgi:hypothetical protein
MPNAPTMLTCAGRNGVGAPSTGTTSSVTTLGVSAITSRTTCTRGSTIGSSGARRFS